ncbi:MAG TPA: DsbA family protein [Woeseiaceae bacterium]|nr:DsbA family protein [Woeseiaceae bacterium]
MTGGKKLHGLTRRLRVGAAASAAVAALLIAIGIVAGMVIERSRHGAGLAATQAATDIDDEAFGNRVRTYILDHPEILQEAARRLRAHAAADTAARDRQAIDENHQALFADPMSPVGGNPEGAVTLVEFFDYNCPYCRRAAPTLEALKAKDPDLRIVYKEFPILGEGSAFAARAALAADRQGRYEEFHNALMKSPSRVSEQVVMEIAAQSELDVDRLRLDMNDPEIAQAIRRNLDLARTLRLTGTPGFVVGKHIFRGIVDEQTLQALIKRARG